MKQKEKNVMVNSIVNTLRHYTEKQDKKQKKYGLTRIERSKCNSSESNTNRNDGNLVKTNTWKTFVEKY